jgi:hypothetical protein
MNMTTNEMNAISRELLESFEATSSLSAISKMVFVLTAVIVSLSLITG